MFVEEKVKEILVDLSGEKTIESETTLQGDLALDSLLMVTLLVKIEEIFEIELDESDMNPYDLTATQNVIDMVKKYVGGDKNEKAC